MKDPGLILTRAYKTDANTVWQIVNSCSQWLLTQKKLDHWSSYYNSKIIENKIETEEVFLVKSDSDIVATVTLSRLPPEYYNEEQLQCFTDTRSTVYISTLAVKPEMQRQGIASKIIKNIELIAKSRNIKNLGLDCRAEYPDLVRFYLKRGFNQVGSFSEGAGQNYLLMEKSIV
jgi:GNAT superfamily N-acetyltransferase